MSSSFVMFFLNPLLIIECTQMTVNKVAYTEQVKDFIFGMTKENIN